MSAAKMMTTTRAGLSPAAASGFQSAPDVGVPGGGSGAISLVESGRRLSAVPSASVTATSAQARNSSCGPQPTACVPFLHTPEYGRVKIFTPTFDSPIRREIITVTEQTYVSRLPKY